MHSYLAHFSTMFIVVRWTTTLTAVAERHSPPGSPHSRRLIEFTSQLADTATNLSIYDMSDHTTIRRLSFLRHYQQRRVTTSRVPVNSA